MLVKESREIHWRFRTESQMSTFGVNCSIIILCFFNGNITLSQPKIKIWKNVTNWTTRISLPLQIILQKLQKLNLKSPKTFWKLSKHKNAVTFRAKADTLHVSVPVKPIARHSKQLDRVHFYTQKVVSNSQFLVFDSDQSHITLKGIATNWSHNGWEEIYPELSKFSVKSITKSVMISPGKYNDKQS